MNDTTIQMIAQAIIANTKVIQSLIDTLPHDVKVAVAEVANVPAQVVPAQVVPAPAQVAPAPVMPTPPTFTDAPAPVASGAPFTDGKGLIDYVMGAYKALGQQKGAGIQTVLTNLGYANINAVKPEHYGALFTGIEALK